MGQTDFQGLLEQIEDTRRRAGVNLDDVPPGSRGGWQMAVRQAKDAVLALERQYVEALQERSVVIALFGDPKRQAAFAATASEEGVLLANVGVFYGTLTERVMPSLRARDVWAVDQHVLTRDLAIAQAVDLGLTELAHDSARAFTPRAVPDLAAAYEAVRDTVRERFGDVIQAAFVRRQLREAALAQQLAPADKPVGVLIVGAREELEATGLMAGWDAPAAATLEAPEIAPSKDDLIRIFRRVKKMKK